MLPWEVMVKILKLFFPFWIFLILFKFGGGLHYSLLAPLGQKVFPLWVVGLLIGASAFLQLLLDVPAGYLLDRYGYKKLLKITTFFFVIASALLLFGITKPIFVLTLVVSAFAWLFFGPGVTAYTMSHASKDTLGKFISSKDVFTSVGIVLSSIMVIFAVNFKTEFLGLILTA